MIIFEINGNVLNILLTYKFTYSRLRMTIPIVSSKPIFENFSKMLVIYLQI